MHKENGFTLLEIMISLVIIAGVLLGTISVIVSVMELNRQTKDINTAAAMAETQLEHISNYPFKQILNDFNKYTFSVDRDGKYFLRSPNAGGDVGYVDFPMVGTELRERYTGNDKNLQKLFTKLNMGEYDLNGDGTIDDTDCAGDYKMLPIHICVRWKSYYGVREYNLYSLIWGQ